MDYTSASVYGTSPQAPSAGVSSPTEALGLDDIRAGWRGLVDPKNPLFWFGALLAVTVGFAGVAGSVRLGRVRVEASAGE